MKKNISMHTESLCYAEINTTVQIYYTSIKYKKETWFINKIYSTIYIYISEKNWSVLPLLGLESRLNDQAIILSNN